MLLRASAIVAGFAPVAGVYCWLPGPFATDPLGLKPIAALAVALRLIICFARLEYLWG